MDVKNRNGFSLIELLVAISIIGIMTTVSAVMITTVRRQREVQVAAEQVKNIIIEAHAYSLSPSTEGKGDFVGVVISDAFSGSPGVRVGQFIRIEHVVDPTGGGTVGTRIIIDKGFSKNIRLTCEKNTGESTADTNPCLQFDAKNANTIGQIDDAGANHNRYHDITVRNEKGAEGYLLVTDKITGNVTVTKENL